MGKAGCLLRVTRSSLPEDIGLEGIVLLESKNQFTVITKRNCIRKINKKDHVFQVLGVSSRFLWSKLIIEPVSLLGSFLCSQSDYEFRKYPNQQLFTLKSVFSFVCSVTVLGQISFS